VINATGVIIHTNLGRAPLSVDAIAAMAAVSRGYSNLEFDLETGERGSRYAHLESVLQRLTGAEAAIAVNNNAAALLLALSAIARDPFDAAQGGREIIISRGQAVEIGGGFRIPDVMRQSGAQLVEVGTTNRTYLRDYESAITPDTAAIMRVHASNFRIVGFTKSPSIRDLARVAHEHGVLVIDDIGSGCLLDVTLFGLAPEPTVQESVTAGADLTLFSGDKLLGGPQAGIIIGKRELIEQLRRHPLARAMRMDKASIAGLSATLLHYMRGEALSKVPVWEMISMPLLEIERRAKRWARAIGGSANVVDGRSMVGGGSLPEESLPTKLVSMAGDGAWVSELARRLRAGEPAVVARIDHDTLLLDPRTVRPDEDRALVAAVKAALAA
jgi:L-seryl-tRNA(Ser) seleniumtransferase